MHTRLCLNSKLALFKRPGCSERDLSACQSAIDLTDVCVIRCMQSLAASPLDDTAQHICDIWSILMIDSDSRSSDESTYALCIDIDAAVVRTQARQAPENRHEQLTSQIILEDQGAFQQQDLHLHSGTGSHVLMLGFMSLLTHSVCSWNSITDTPRLHDISATQFSPH
jgi:hypothetical protein